MCKHRAVSPRINCQCGEDGRGGEDEAGSLMDHCTTPEILSLQTTSYRR